MELCIPSRAYSHGRQAEASLDSKVLCDADCAASLADKERVRTASGLEYIDLVPGKGPSPRIGFQASAGPRHAGPPGPWLVGSVLTVITAMIYKCLC